MKTILTFVFIFASVYSLFTPAVAKENPSVILTTDIDLEQSSRQFECNVNVKFSDSALYNDSIKLSYHVYDKKGNLIVFENIRIPLILLADDEGYANLLVDLDENNELENYNWLIIRLDLVDEKNIFWFNDNKNIDVTTVEIIYRETFISKLYNILTKIWYDQPILLIINVLADVAVLSAVFILYKKNQRE